MAEPFVRLTAIAAPLIEDNIDTDIIIPSREMRTTGRTGLADGLFAGRRYRAGTRDPAPAFVLNRPEFAGARFLLAGANFGCGSSREHAVWALAEWGIRAVIAPSFAPIFAANAVRGGVVPVVLAADAVAWLAAADAPLTVDLETQTVAGGGRTRGFAIDAEARAMLLGGLDEIGLTLDDADAIAAWREADRTARPWVYLCE